MNCASECSNSIKMTHSLCSEACFLYDELHDLMEPPPRTKHSTAPGPCSKGSCFGKSCPKGLCLYDINPQSEQAGPMEDPPTQTPTETGNSSQTDMNSHTLISSINPNDNQTGNKGRDHGVPSDTQISEDNPNDDRNRDNGNQSKFDSNESIGCRGVSHITGTQTTGDNCTGGHSSNNADGRSMAPSKNQEESNGQGGTTAKSSRFRTWGTLAAVGAATALSAYLLKGRKGWDRFR
jgi:hypothetical protein